jgi:stearoyl-CoA desaturase (Delta-9 desaturase)
MMKLQRFRLACLAVAVLPTMGFIAAVWLSRNRGRVGLVELGVCGLMFLATFVGIEVGYHRHFVHRSFRATSVARHVLGALGSMAWQGSVIWWAGIHRTHHQFPDREGDPHSPLDGFYRAHMGWLLGININPPYWTRRVKDLIRDPEVAAVHRQYLLWAIVGIVGPAVAVAILQGSWYGLLTGFLWGGPVRICLVNHIVWSVNSVCHCFGGKPYQTHDLSCNNYLLMLPSMGFSLHNNHHAFPSSATTSHAWWQIDLSGLIIRLLAICGAAWDVTVPSRELMAQRKKHSTSATETTNSHSAMGEDVEFVSKCSFTDRYTPLSAVE